MFERNAYLEKMRARKHNGLIKVITGTRRAGKSFLLNTIFYADLLESGVNEENIIKFAFDVDEDMDILDVYYPEMPTKIADGRGGYKVNAKKFRAYISERTRGNGDYYLLLDEIQLLEDFISTLNGFLRHANYDVYVTGSNSKFLSSDIETEFRGRGSVIHVFPLTFLEYCQGLNLTPDAAWRKYVETGGIPLVASMQSSEEKIEYLKELCNEVYLKDIIARNKVRKTADLSDLLDVIASSIGSPVSPTKLMNTFKSVKSKDVTDDTIKKFLDYFQDAFLVSKASKYDIRGRAFINSPFKVYFEDIGVRNARLNFRQIEESHIMENIIYNELRYRGFDVCVGEMDISEKTDRMDKNKKYIYKSKSLEVDFIATSGSRKYYIQSALEMKTADKEEQEKRPLWNIDDSFKKIVITKDGLEPRRDEKGIVTIDLFDFLLNPNSLNL